MNRMAFLSFIFCGISFFSTAAYSQIRNPLHRSCNLAGGLVQNIRTASQQDELPFCRLGSALMGSESLMASQNAELTQASYALKSFSTCESAGGHTFEGLTFSGNSLEYCEFNDQSRIELMTLEKGPNDPSNALLIKALNLN